MKPRILVAAPVWEEHSYIIERYLRRIKNLSYPNYDILLVDNSKNIEFFKYLLARRIKVLKSLWSPNPLERITLARNYIINYLLEHKEYKYVFFIDTDTIIPKDGIEILLKHKKDLVGFLCHMGFKKKVPCVLKSGHIIYHGRRGLNYYTWKEIKKMKNLVKVYATSVGCLLVHRKIFEKGVRFRYTPFINVGEDLWFFSEVNAYGFQFWLDKSIRVKHYNKDRSKRFKEVVKAVKKCRQWKK